MQILLTRHGEVDNSGRYIGITDLPITANGEQQVVDLAGKVAALKPDICLCSPMLRTKQTAEVISKAYFCETIYIDDLKEINFGLWEELTFKEIAEHYPDQTKEWADNYADFTFPEGDNTKAFFNNICVFGRELSRRNEETILLVTHGGVIRALICFFLGLGFAKHLLFNARPAGLTIIELFAEQGVLKGFNL